MSRPFIVLLLFCTVLLLRGAATAQYYSEDPYKDEARPILGTPFKTGPVRVYLTDEETGRPYADREVRIRYYWQWDVTKPTPQTEHMSNIRYFEVKATSDEKGFIRVPGRTTYPARPVLPGADASAPYFHSIAMIVQDDKHSTALSIYSPGRDFTDENGDIRHIVRLYPRPVKAPGKP
jgi:hypothetical protein